MINLFEFINKKLNCNRDNILMSNAIDLMHANNPAHITFAPVPKVQR